MGSSASFFGGYPVRGTNFATLATNVDQIFKPLVLGKCSGKNFDGKNDIRISESRINLFFNNLL